MADIARKIPLNVDRTVLLALAAALPFSIAAVNIVLVPALALLLLRVTTDASLRRQFTSEPAIVALFVFIALDFIAAAACGYPRHWRSFFEDKWVYVVLLATAGLCRKVWLKSILGAFLASGLVSAGYGVVQFFAGWDFVRGGELEAYGSGFLALGTFNHHLTYGGVILILLAMCGAWAFFSNSPIWVWTRLLTVAVAAIALLVSYARSAVLGAGAALAVSIAFLDKRIRRRAAAAGAVAFTLLILLTPGMTQRFARIFSPGEHNEGTRMRLWKTSVQMIAAHPIFGIGQSNFSHLFDAYKVDGEYNSTAHPHNDLLSVAVDGGLPALLAFLAMWMFLIRRLLRGIKRTSAPSIESAAVRGALLAAVGIIVAGLFQNYQSDAEVANALWFCIGLGLRASYGEAV